MPSIHPCSICNAWQDAHDPMLICRTCMPNIVIICYDCFWDQAESGDMFTVVERTSLDDFIIRIFLVDQEIDETHEYYYINVP